MPSLLIPVCLSVHLPQSVGSTSEPQALDVPIARPCSSLFS